MVHRKARLAVALRHYGLCPVEEITLDQRLVGLWHLDAVIVNHSQVGPVADDVGDLLLVPSP